MANESLDKEKARRAAAHPDRPGEQCRAEAGAYQPVIDHARCEGKRDCVEVCPYVTVKRDIDVRISPGYRWRKASET